MTLTTIEFVPPKRPFPEQVTEFLAYVEPLVEKHRTKVPAGFRGFVASDYHAFYLAITHLADLSLACGNAFCEWGSGLGVSTCLASMSGFHANGIEIDEALVQAAEEIAEVFELDVDYALGSFLPEGADDLIDEAFGENDGSISMVTQPDIAYDQLGRGLEEFDVIFCFPWPTDEELTARIFDRFASSGAILLTYDETEGYSIRRKD
jgi:hypothetical protein